jgi:hypothetical protein
MPLFSFSNEQVQLGPPTCRISGILILYGLPRLLTGSILAHELMHAWLRLGGHLGLAPRVEEGLCQLMALLWLDSRQQELAPGSFEERLQSCLASQIRTDPSEVYGDGFRDAYEGFQRHGLQTVLAHVAHVGRVPN